MEYIKNIMKNILSYIVTSGIITYFFIHYNNKKLEREKWKNSKNLQIDNYFRSISGEELKSVLDFWASIIFKLGENNNITVSDMRELQQKTFMYGSDKTVKILSKFQQNSYKNNPNNQKGLIYAALIMCSLKNDFSGIEINPLTILELKLKDFYKNEDELKKYYNEILLEIKDI
jgi:hypothetical protein